MRARPVPAMVRGDPPRGVAVTSKSSPCADDFGSRFPLNVIESAVPLPEARRILGDTHRSARAFVTGCPVNPSASAVPWRLLSGFVSGLV